MEERAWEVHYDAANDRGSIKRSADPTLDVVIQFQHGPIGENGESGVNGIQNEELLALLELRIRALDGQFPCEENKTAVMSIHAALAALMMRTRRRVEQGVEGKNEPHVSV